MYMVKWRIYEDWRYEYLPEKILTDVKSKILLALSYSLNVSVKTLTGEQMATNN